MGSSSAVRPGRVALFVSIATVGCAVDLVTKHWAFAALGMPGQRPAWWLIPEVAGFQTSLNEGALFGMGQGFSLVFAALSIIAAVAVVVWLFVYGAAEDRWLTVALACVMAGIFGNLYDRLALHGLTWPPGYLHHEPGSPVHAVRDFILVMIGDWPWPTFNVADSLLVCGGAMLLLHAVMTPSTSPDASPDEAPPPSSPRQDPSCEPDGADESRR